MKKYRVIFSALFSALLLLSILLWILESQEGDKATGIVSSNYTFASISDSYYNAMLNGDTATFAPRMEDKTKVVSINTSNGSMDTTVSGMNGSKNSSLEKSNISANNIRLSRGGSPPKNTANRTYLSKIETLDWWKEARYVFAINSVAEVTDVKTNKSFKVKRTMGTNHADAEALTSEDTKIIKDIWGGFSWERRPVIVKVDGRKLAASMSAMPHAGIDSAPAFKVVDSRSLGYGRGENLDVIKGNKMDGHFDIHFLNSTRHKDGKKDPDHQTAILKVFHK